MDLVEAGERRLGLVRRFPIGPIAAITPFNFPLNLVLHKVAPALASGNTVVVKPSPRTPQTAAELGRLFAESGLPEGALTVLPPEACGAEIAVAMAGDPRFKMLTFTGSAEVGWALKARAGKKRVVLELGGNSGAIVHGDADLEYAAGRIVAGGFAFAGQSCVSVQRIFVERGVYPCLLELLTARVRQLKVGDPFEETTDVGPMIDLAAAERAEAWIQEAAGQGALVVTGGRRDGRLLEPCILTNTRPEMVVNCREVFAPLVTVTPYDSFDEALALVNGSNFGLHAGVFTRDNARIFQAFETLEVGGVIVNDVPTYRVDHMPYGGSKDSGFGREGLRYAMEEMTEPRIMVLNLQ
jgi:glyceraldehyde-3-phosphate dehydrogenase (NADP+)